MNISYWTILFLGLKYIAAGIIISIFCWLLVNSILKEYNITIKHITVRQ
jgi:hypothetical protein